MAGLVPAVLRKGPRGGGRDRDAIVAHVRETELLHARMLGLKERPFPASDAAAVARVRAAVLARRIAWHALDHAWEIEDKREL